MSDSEESAHSDQQYSVEQTNEDDNRRRTRRRDSKYKKPVDYGEDEDDALGSGRYEEDEDYHEPGKKKKNKGSEKKKSKKDRKSKQDSEDETTLDDSALDESQRSVPPLKIKLPLREKSRRSSKRKNETDDSLMAVDEPEEEDSVYVDKKHNDDELEDAETAGTSRAAKAKAPAAQPLVATDETPSAPTRRSERIFVSATKKEREPDEAEKEDDDLKDFKIIHKDYCQGCRQGGELILCDYCPRAYHKVCLDEELEDDELPDDWCCPHCQKNGKPDLRELKQQQEAAKKKKKQKETTAQGKSIVGGKPKAKEIENNDYCESCNQCGELLLCDTCPRAYHYVCIEAEVKDIPSGAWSCPHCIKNGLEPPTEAEGEKTTEKAEKIICKTCRQAGGEILFCASCGTRVHPRCLNPPLDVAPETWYCLACSVEPLKGKVQRILAWRWKRSTSAEKEKEAEDNVSAEDSTKHLLKSLKNRKPREREFFVKWKDMSYWHCSWIDDSQLQVFHSNMYRSYMQKNDMNNPTLYDEMGMPMTEISAPKIETESAAISDDAPALPSEAGEEDENDGMDQSKAASVAAKHRRRKRCHTLPTEIEENYIRYGVRPEWLQIHRIVNHRKSRSKMFYVIKWRDLAYEEVTVEPDPENCDFDIPNYGQKIEEYWNLKRLVEAETGIAEGGEEGSSKHKKDKKRDKKDKKKKSSVISFGTLPKSEAKRKWETQPEYIPEPLKLHDYQKDGINWLRYSWASGIDTILADEMGLGKTIQTVVFLYSLYKEGHTRGPFLIAAPLSTIINWERELEDWAPDFYVVNYTGNKDSRIIIRENELSFDADAIRSSQKAMRIRKHVPVKFHVLLTSYELINVDSALLGSIDWKVLVVDEAHRLKSNQSLFFRTLNSYSVGHKLLLTGTPLQNNLEELFNLLNFLSPNRFSDMEGFLNEFADIAKEEQVKKLHELLGPHLLRRLKADVLTGMPAKSEFIIRVDLAPLQKKYYKYILTRNYDALNTKGGGKQVSLLNIVMDLKKCCNHPYLFPVASDEAPKTKLGYYEGPSLVKASGKLVVLHKMLRKLKDEGHRVLIFSQMTQMLDILEDFLEAEGYRYERIDGSITGLVRQEAIDRFNAPGAQQFVFLLSTRAGGLGINLATADTVVIYDSDWNPHNDIQALSRAHRIGQTNKVMIYRFVTRNSVEERITQVAKKKMMLTHLVVRPGLGSAKTNTAMSKQELDDILKFGTEQLFKEEEGKESETIHYDDKAIGEMLDRSQEGIEQKEMWANEYLSSFKVASYRTKEAEEEEEEESQESTVAVKDKTMDDSNDPHYWEKLLGVHYIQYQENQTRTLGKGKRVRKQVNYMDSANGQNEFQNNYSSDSSDFSVPSDVSENDDDFDERSEGASGIGAGGRSSKSLRAKTQGREKMPPLFTSIGPNTEVLGFTPKHRKIFLELIMRFGLPSFDQNLVDSQYFVRELKHKSEKHLRAYTSLFFTHLCEPGDPSATTFEDSVPKEGLNVNQVLTRIGIISLIKRKVYAYQSYHGAISLPKPKPKVIKTQVEAAPVAGPSNSEESAKPEETNLEETKNEIDQQEPKVEPMEVEESKDVKVEAETTSTVKKEDESTDAEVNKEDEKDEKPQESIEMDQTVSSTKMETEESAEPTNGQKEEEDTVEDKEETTPDKVKEFEFNIEDGHMTELQDLWYFEERELKPGHEHEIWNRRHDYWLLAGIVKHGYDRFSDIANDMDLLILSMPFRTSPGLREKFMDRRLKLLEQALVFEEQLRRFKHLESVEKYVKPEKEKQDEEADEEEKKKKDEEKDVEEEEDKQDDDKKEEAKVNGAKNGGEGEASETVEDKENSELILNPMVQKAANQLEDLLIDMKSDCARIPQTVQRIPSIANRLQLVQRNLQQTAASAGMPQSNRIA